MRTIARTDTSHGLRDDVFRFFRRDRFAGSFDLGKIFPQVVRNLQPALWRNLGWLERPDTYRLTVLNAAAQERFECSLLGERSLALQIIAGRPDYGLTG